MKSNLFKLSVISTGLFLVACSVTTPSSNYDPEKSYQITIIHTNDHHGRFWSNKYGEYGMAARKTLIDSIRADVAASGGQSLLLSGGDINTGVPESDLQDAEPDFKGMSMIGYDAMAIGNHEFDNSIDVLRKQESWANFPMLAANIYQKSTGERLFAPYEIFDLDGLQVAVMGLTTDDTVKIGNPEYLGDIQFTSPIDEAAKVVPELREKAQIIIAATHMGHYVDAQHSINAPGDVTLAREVNGIDLIVGGHSQDPVCMAAQNEANTDFKAGDACVPDTQNGTVIVQAHEWGKYVGRADFTFIGGELSLDSYQLIPVNLKKKIKVDGESKRVLIADAIAEDAAMVAFLQPYQDSGAEELNAIVSNSNGKLEGDRNVVRFQPTNLGELIALAQMTSVKADLGVINSGGIRDSIAAGDISYKDVLKVQPFANIVSYVEMTGSELKDYLAALAAMPIDSGAFAQFGGVSFDYANGKVSNLYVYGRGKQKVQDDLVYRMSVNSFSASGGDKYPKLSDHPGFVNSGLVDAAVLKDYLADLGSVDVADYEPGTKVTRR
ncbi:bifunctional UDP-sugar hydrolase/5'-nucleotidase [Alginatibacterium sediminis]|uniref:Bifunctional UDP-sugar hydrolase/5'-nucleotidase n=1 Tax=Alginatibacterium sediminis TaxID=2164068 RepID=A0A420ELJ2_9ALTE|nr:bifunctional UDP-sugar hydrolase/5'-nucleotidase UshA [Alginatibacterium sediminis]RKF21510.1 bifunctional UDP-sugar hydrolase/5'-nucleotidase [Alginatibacterium sediminis]